MNYAPPSINHLSGINTSFSYNAFGRVGSVTYTDTLHQPPSITWGYTYDQFGRNTILVTPKDQNNNQHYVYQCYDLNNQVVYSVANPSSAPSCINDGSNGTWQTPPQPPTCTYSNAPATDQDTNIQNWTVYDGLGRATDTYDAICRHNITTYDGIGRVSSTTKNYNSTWNNGQFDPSHPEYNNLTTFNYYTETLTEDDTVWFATPNPSPNTPKRDTHILFDILGNKILVSQNTSQTATTATDQNIITAYQYDLLGHVIEQSNPATDPSPQFMSDGSGRIAGGQTNYTTFTYDALGHKLTTTSPTTNPSSDTTTATYDDLGEQTSIVGPDTPLTAYDYDGLQRQTSQTVGSIILGTDYSLFATQRAVTQTDGNGVKTVFAYDWFGNPLSAKQNTNFAGSDNDQNVETDFSYDNFGHLTGVKLPGNSQPTRTYVYDQAGRVKTVKQLADSVWQTWQTSYDAAGRVIGQLTPLNTSANQWNTTTYDNLDDIISIQRANNADNVAFNYSYIPAISGNAVDEQVKRTDGTTSPIYTYSNYDDMSRLTGVNGGITNQSLAYSYDKGGEGLTVSMPSGRTATYAYNPNGSLQSVTLNSGWSNGGTSGITSYSYYQGHLLNTIQFPNGILETLKYDQYNRLKSIDYTAGTTLLFHIDYTIDNNGNRIVANESLNQSSPCTGTCTAIETDTIGVYRGSGSNNAFYLRNANSTGSADVTATLSPAGSKRYPVVGNWSGSGKDTIGIFDQSNGAVYLRNTNTSGSADTQFTFGTANDIPVAGRWSAVNPNDGFGVFRPSNGLMYLTNSITKLNVDYTIVFGIPGDQVITGNWKNGTTGTASNADGVGVYRPSTSYFYLVNTVANGTLTANYSFQFGTAGGGYTAIAGNWTGLPSGFGVGLFLNGTFSLKNVLAPGPADNTFQFGIAGDIPVAGNWQTPHMPAPNVLVPPTATPLTPVNPAPTSVAPPTDGLIDMAPPPPQPMSYIDPNTTTNPPSDSASAMPASSTVTLLNRQIVYGYDNLNRLTGAQYQDNGVDTYNFAYTYDQNSNRLTSNELFAPTSTILDSTTYYYNNDANQLKSAVAAAGTTGTTYYGYSVDGMLTGTSFQPTGGSSTPQQGFSYDTADRLTYNINYTSNLGISYLYDGQNNLARKSVSTGGYTNYLVDPSGQLPQLMAEYPSSGATTYYAPGLGMNLGQDTSGTLSYFGTDGLGSVRTLFDTTGAQRDLTNYAPYGATLEHSGDLSSHLGFTGALTDDSGLVYLNARFYNPASGQFMGADPLEGTAANPGSFNKYGYVGGNPINRGDPSGKLACNVNNGSVPSDPGNAAARSALYQNWTAYLEGCEIGASSDVKFFSATAIVTDLLGYADNNLLGQAGSFLDGFQPSTRNFLNDIGKRVYAGNADVFSKLKSGEYDALSGLKSPIDNTTILPNALDWDLNMVFVDQSNVDIIYTNEMGGPISEGDITAINTLLNTDLGSSFTGSNGPYFLNGPEIFAAVVFGDNLTGVVWAQRFFGVRSLDFGNEFDRRAIGFADIFHLHNMTEDNFDTYMNYLVDQGYSNLIFSANGVPLFLPPTAEQAGITYNWPYSAFH